MRAIVLVIDSFGIGAAPDAEKYGDQGANTALHICEQVEHVQWPYLQQLGLGNCATLLGNNMPGCAAATEPQASFGVMAPASAGKDTTTGHWELAGVRMIEPLRTFPMEFPSFPVKMLEEFSQRTGHKVLGNYGASGTAIIAELGERHLDGEGVILYTSADSVLQIAAHEELVNIDELYRICLVARDICDREGVGRVIARPFTGAPGNFTRTTRRKDFSLKPPEPTIIQRLQESGVKTIGVGKIGDIFAGQGFDQSFPEKGNELCLDRLCTLLAKSSGENQFLFVNLVDTDMLYGHRRDVQGYHDAVMRIDRRLGECLKLLGQGDLFIITADHGCDPTHGGTDHTREYVPLLAYTPGAPPCNLGVRESFTDVAQSLADYFSIVPMSNGLSWLAQNTVKKEKDQND